MTANYAVKALHRFLTCMYSPCCFGLYCEQSPPVAKAEVLNASSYAGRKWLREGESSTYHPPLLVESGGERCCQLNSTHSLPTTTQGRLSLKTGLVRHRVVYVQPKLFWAMLERLRREECGQCARLKIGSSLHLRYCLPKDSLAQFEFWINTGLFCG